MNIFNEFLAEYGFEILHTAAVILAGILGISLRRIAVRLFNDKTKTAVVKTAVKAVEQIAREIHGEEKLERAKAYAVDALNEKGVAITQLELELLIEAAVSEFNTKLP